MLGLTSISGLPISSVGWGPSYLTSSCYTVYLAARAMTVKLRCGISKFAKAGT